MSETTSAPPAHGAQNYSGTQNPVGVSFAQPVFYVVEQRVLALLACGASPENLADSVQLEAVGNQLFRLKCREDSSLPSLGTVEQTHELLQRAFTPKAHPDTSEDGTVWFVQRPQDGRPRVGKVDLATFADGLSNLEERVASGALSQPAAPDYDSHPEV